MSRPDTDSLIDRSQIERHLSILFGASVEGGAFFSVFTLPDRRSRFFREIPPAVDYCADRAAAGEHVYVCLGLFAEPVKEGRGTATDTIGIPALWSDVDIRDPDAHKSPKPYPPSLADALDVSKIGPYAPSFYVHSGNGVHPYWMLNEPRIFRSDRDRNDVGILLQRWQGSIRSRAKARGWTIDSVHDLVRVLRVAGTVNWKDKDRPKRVVLSATDEPIREYDLDSMETVMVAVEYVQTSGAYRSLGDVSDFLLDPEASMPDQTLKALLANSIPFRETWKRNRPDLADQSASSYDFALANYLVRAELDDQTIVNALIQWRRMHGEPAKLRVDYYQRSIGKVRASVDQERALARVEETAHQLPEIEDSSLLASEDRERYVQEIRAMLRINLSRFVQVNLDAATFFIVLEDGTRFSLGQIKNVVYSHLFRERIAERMGVLLDEKDVKKQWPLVSKMLFAIREYEDTEEPTTAIACRSLLVEYLDSTRLFSEEEWKGALRDRSAFKREGMVYVNTDAFATWVRTNRNNRITGPEIVRDFKILGLESFRVEGRDDRGDRKNRTYWRWPCAELPEIFPFENGASRDR